MLKNSVAALGVLVSLTSFTAAFTLINEDDETHSVQVTIGEGDAKVEVFELGIGETKTDLCDIGCEMLLDSGDGVYVEGDMTVIIRDGEFFRRAEDEITD